MNSHGDSWFWWFLLDFGNSRISEACWFSMYWQLGNEMALASQCDFDAISNMSVQSPKCLCNFNNATVTKQRHKSGIQEFLKSKTNHDSQESLCACIYIIRCHDFNAGAVAWGFEMFVGNSKFNNNLKIKAYSQWVDTTPDDVALKTNILTSLQKTNFPKCEQ